MIGNIDPGFACCGDPGDCNRAHLYCFNRTPKEADVTAMNKFEQDKIKTPEQRKAFDVAFDAARGAAHLLPPEVILSEDEVIHQAEQAAAQAIINAATHGSVAFDPEDWGTVPRQMVLSGDSKTRKETPICAGVLDYFPLALAAIARLSKMGNDKHNPGQPLHWSRDKSTDHADCIVRHLIDRGTIDPETGELHDAAVAWRALAQLQLAEEKRLTKG